MISYNLKKFRNDTIEVQWTYSFNDIGISHKQLVDICLFIPSHIASQVDLSKDEYYQNIRIYNRYDIPIMSLDKIVDANNTLSPLIRLETLQKETMYIQDINIEYAIYEMKFLLNIIRAYLGEFAYGIVSHNIPMDDIPAVVAHVVEMQHRLERMRGFYVHQSMNSLVRTSYLWILEGISIQIEDTFLRLCADDTPYYELLNKESIRQSNYRREEGMSVKSTTDKKLSEQYLHRKHALKKWVQSTLYMSFNRSKQLSLVQQVMFSLASAIAMSFAVVATVLSLYVYQQRSLGWALIAIIAYVFKDRLKEWLRLLLSKAIPNLVSDRIHFILMPRLGIKCGKIKEWFRLIDANKVPTDIAMRRSHTLTSDHTILQETTVWYCQSMNINTARLKKHHQRLTSCIQIVRIDLSPWLNRITKSTKKLRVPVEDGITTIEANMIKTIDVMLRISSENKVSVVPYRLTVNRSGILRIETLK